MESTGNIITDYEMLSPEDFMSIYFNENFEDIIFVCEGKERKGLDSLAFNPKQISNKKRS